MQWKRSQPATASSPRLIGMRMTFPSINLPNVAKSIKIFNSESVFARRPRARIVFHVQTLDEIKLHLETLLGERVRQTQREKTRFRGDSVPSVPEIMITNWFLLPADFAALREL